jgi:hypothetical protein
VVQQLCGLSGECSVDAADCAAVCCRLGCSAAGSPHTRAINDAFVSAGDLFCTELAVLRSPPHDTAFTYGFGIATTKLVSPAINSLRCVPRGMRDTLLVWRRSPEP